MNVTYVVVDEFGCIDSLNQNVIVSDETVVPLLTQIDTTICQGETLSLDAGNAGMTFLWNAGESSQTKNVAAAVVRVLSSWGREEGPLRAAGGLSERTTSL